MSCKNQEQFEDAKQKKGNQNP